VTLENASVLPVVFVYHFLSSQISKPRHATYQFTTPGVTCEQDHKHSVS